MNMPIHWPTFVGSAKRTTVATIARNCAERIARLPPNETQEVVVTLSHDYSVWLELPGHFLPEEWVCNIDRIRSPIETAAQIAEDLQTAKEELIFSGRQGGNKSMLTG